jgi:hypothetical protein
MLVWLKKMILAQCNCRVCAHWLVKGAAMLCTCIKECNKYDVTAAQCFSLAHCNDWSRWAAISIFTSVCSPNFSFLDEVGKKRSN